MSAVLAAGAAAVALAPALLAGPATAAETDSVLTGLLRWTQLGTQPGAPGNAHSGLLAVVSDESYVGFTLIDWRCPRGVRPPLDMATDGPCTQLRRRELNSPTGTQGTTTYTGPLSVRVAGTFDSSTYRYDGDGNQTSVTYGTATVAARVERVGPITSTTDEDGRTTTTAPMRLRGRAADVSFDRPGYRQVSDWVRAR